MVLLGCCFPLLVLTSTWTPTAWCAWVPSFYRPSKQAQADPCLLYSIPHSFFPPIVSNFKGYFPHSRYISERKTSLSSPVRRLQLGPATESNRAIFDMVLINTEALREAGADPLGFG